MLIVDDILLFPIRGIRWIFEQIHDIATEELEGEADRIRESLTDLYMMLETGLITEEEFDEKEKEYLDRLDALEAEMEVRGEFDEDEDEDDEEDQEFSDVEKDDSDESPK